MKILLTGFDPFGGEKINPAYEAVKKVTAPDGKELIKLEVPTVFGKSIKIVTDAIELHKPDAVICIGQAGGRAAVTPERIAINIADAESADNEGNRPIDEPVIFGGENALFSTLPVKKMIEAINSAGVPARISNSAGTFVCNQLMYGVLSYCRIHCPDTIAGFIHVPFLPQQVENRENIPSMTLEDMVKALNAALAVL